MWGFNSSPEAKGLWVGHLTFLIRQCRGRRYGFFAEPRLSEYNFNVEMSFSSNLPDA